MQSLFRPAAMAAALLALAPVVAACFAGDDHGEYGDCSGDVIEFAGLVYYVITGNTPDQGWGYLETNGEPGLQRGGCGGVLLGSAWDPCQESDYPDSLFY